MRQSRLKRASDLSDRLDRKSGPQLGIHHYQYRPFCTQGGNTPESDTALLPVWGGGIIGRHRVCCHSSGVEHFIGNEEVQGSIPCDSTSEVETKAGLV